MVIKVFPVITKGRSRIPTNETNIIQIVIPLFFLIPRFRKRVNDDTEHNIQTNNLYGQEEHETEQQLAPHFVITFPVQIQGVADTTAVALALIQSVPETVL